MPTMCKVVAKSKRKRTRKENWYFLNTLHMSGTVLSSFTHYPFHSARLSIPIPIL